MTVEARHHGRNQAYVKMYDEVFGILFKQYTCSNT